MGLLHHTAFRMPVSPNGQMPVWRKWAAGLFLFVKTHLARIGQKPDSWDGHENRYTMNEA